MAISSASVPLAPFQQMPQGSSHDLAFYSHSGELRSYSDVPKSGPIPEPLQRELIHGYAACVSYIDAQVGLLMKTLETAGIADNTPVLVGAGQFTERVDAPDYKGLPPYAIAAQAARVGVDGAIRCSRSLGW